MTTSVTKYISTAVSTIVLSAVLCLPAAGETLQRIEDEDVFSQFISPQTQDYGACVPMDDQQTFLWNRDGAEQGVASAQLKLGWMYHKGEGVPKDDQQAVFWFRKAAEQGLADAQFKLG